MRVTEFQTSKYHEKLIYHFPNDKKITLSKLKAFADDKKKCNINDNFCL